MATGIISAMSHTKLVSDTSSSADTESLFVGPFRDLLREKKVLLHLKKIVEDLNVRVEEGQSGGDTVANQIRLLASSAILHSIATQEPLQDSELLTVISYFHSISEHTGSSIYASAGFW